MRIMFLHPDYMVNFIESIKNKHEQVLYLIVPAAPWEEETAMNIDGKLYTAFKILPNFYLNEVDIEKGIKYLLQQHNCYANKNFGSVMLYSPKYIEIEIKTIAFLENYINPIFLDRNRIKISIVELEDCISVFYFREK